MSECLRIVLVEDDPVWRDMLTKFLNNEPDFNVVLATGYKEEAIAYCASTQVDVVLMDLNLTANHLDGIEAILELSLMDNRAKVIAVTSVAEDDAIIDAFTAGAIHYVRKSDFRRIPDTIREAVTADSPQETLVKEFIRMKEEEQYRKLTNAEREIVFLSEKGLSRVRMQEKLGKAESTLKNQITSILRKFHAKTLRDVVRSIRRRGLDDREIR